jgi:hypothetical protein
MERALRLLGTGGEHRGRMLGGFVDSLLQMFENCRAGLSDETLRKGPEGVERFFLDLYEKERGRLSETIQQQEQHLSVPDRRELFERVDERIHKVVLPAYVRLAARFTPRERNDFYLAPEPLHALERLGFTLAGMAIGAFAVWAPFIPLWQKEWVLAFALAGLVFPGIRRFLSLRRYQAELNALVTRTDNEIWRMDLAYLTDDMSQKAAGTAGADDATTEDARLRARIEGAPRVEATRSGRHSAKEGGR